MSLQGNSDKIGKGSQPDMYACWRELVDVLSFCSKGGI